MFSYRHCTRNSSFAPTCSEAREPCSPRSNPQGMSHSHSALERTEIYHPHSQCNQIDPWLSCTFQRGKVCKKESWQPHYTFLRCTYYKRGNRARNIPLVRKQRSPMPWHLTCSHRRTSRKPSKCLSPHSSFLPHNRGRTLILAQRRTLRHCTECIRSSRKWGR